MRSPIAGRRKGGVADAPRLESGSIFDNYRIEGFAGRGGMALVYRAVQLDHTERPVALKVIAPEYANDREFRERFIREARMAASIENANVLSIYEASEHRGVLFLAMQYVDGTDLQQLIATEGALTPARAVGLIAPIGDALAEAHSKGLIHRDVKPGNILVRRGNEMTPERAFLSDFGVARSEEFASGRGSTRVVGTVEYMAPEQLEGRPDYRSDIYALGCVLYEALTGRLPFNRDTPAALMWAHLNEAPTPLREVVPELPEQFQTAITRALAKDPNQRYQSAAEFAADLRRAADAAPGASATVAGGGTVVAGGTAPSTPPPATPAPAPTAAADAGTPPPPAYGTPPPPPPPAGGTPQAGGGYQAGTPRPASPPPSPPFGSPPAQTGGSSSKLPLIIGGAVAAIAVIAVIAVVALSGGSSSSKPKPQAPTDAQQVQSQVAAYFASSGPAGCNFLSPTYIANNYGGSLANCQSQLQSSQAEPIQTAQQVQISGPTTATSTFWTQFHHDQMSVVKSNGKWLMDDLTSLDKRDIHTVVNQWEGAVGSATCNYYSQGFLSRVYNGDLTACQQKHANDQAAPPPTGQDISATNDGHATDTFTAAGKTFTLHMILKGQTWQIDDITQQ